METNQNLELSVETETQTEMFIEEKSAYDEEYYEQPFDLFVEVMDEEEKKTDDGLTSIESNEKMDESDNLSPSNMSTQSSDDRPAPLANALVKSVWNFFSPSVNGTLL